MNSTSYFSASTRNDAKNATLGPIYHGWGFTAYSGLIILLAVLTMNSVTLILFARNPQTRTSFALYLICLLFSNIFYAVLHYPLFIMSSLYSTWKLSSGWCTVYLYASDVASVGAVHSHVLVTMNRLWALTWPHNYRNRHSKTVALLMCGSMWVYIHALMLPGVVLDDLYYRVPLTGSSCYLNTQAQPEWSIAVQFLMYEIPQIFILVAFPYICYKQSRRRARFGRRVEDAPKADPGTGVHSRSLTIATDQQETSELASETRSRAFLLLTLLTVSIFICWTPANVFYAARIFVSLHGYARTIETVLTLYALQGVLDPLMFVLALKDLRESLRQFC